MKRILLALLWLSIFCGGFASAGHSQVTIAYEGNSVLGGDAQLEVISPGGVRVLVDVYDPGKLSTPVTKNDILLTSHIDPFAEKFVRTFPGRKIEARIGEIKQADVYIRGIAAAHRLNDQMPDKNGSDYIYLIETAGLRIAAFGNIGQKKLTVEQLNALGRVDVAITPLYIMNNDMTAHNLKAFHLMDQVHPKLIIPTSADLGTAQYGVRHWQGFYQEEPVLKVAQGDLPHKPRIVFIGPLAKPYGKACKLVKSEPKVSIRHEGNSQFEISSADGTRVLIDVYDPKWLSSPVTKSDILLTTHTHVENYLDGFVRSFPGKQLMACDGEINQSGVHIVGMAAGHRNSGKLGTDHIFLIEMDGLKIAHFGDIGQEKLTKKQLQILGKVDIALTQFFNIFSNMDSTNLMGFNLMDQIHPKIVIPTNLDIATAQYAVKKWKGFYWDDPELRMGPSNLPKKTRIIFIGPHSRQYAAICKVPKLKKQ